MENIEKIIPEEINLVCNKSNSKIPYRDKLIFITKNPNA
jgi:hypothetical protein